MRIFLSHASEEHADADRLAIALRTRQHKVFLDSNDLPPAGDYQSRIERAIKECNLFCFLISSSSISSGRFTMSELALARRRWPDPAGRVLPIMIHDVPISSVPPYLRHVSILKPQGDLVADALRAIQELQPPRFQYWPSSIRSWPNTRLPVKVVLPAAILVLVGLSVWFSSYTIHYCWEAVNLINPLTGIWRTTDPVIGSAEFGGIPYAKYELTFSDVSVELNSIDAHISSGSAHGLMTEKVLNASFETIPPNTHKFLLRTSNVYLPTMKADLAGEAGNQPSSTATFTGYFKNGCAIPFLNLIEKQCTIVVGELGLVRTDSVDKLNWVVTIPITLVR
jgi:TIR domain-containing protein